MNWGWPICLAGAILTGCASSPTTLIRDEATLRAAIGSGARLQLAAGEMDIHREIVVPPGTENLEISGTGTLLKAARDFRGAALFRVDRATGVTFRNLAIDGVRGIHEQRTGLPPSDVPFARFTRGSAIAISGSRNITVADVRFRRVAGFAVLASRCLDLQLDRLTVEDSGSRNAAGRNNTTGGVLIEEGTRGFEIRSSTFRNIRGNAVWTHSLYTSARNQDGRIWGNRFDTIGRDAIQIGHATRIRVEGNVIRSTGYPLDDVDIENGAIPVGIDTAGNVDRSVYIGNRIEETNGKCIDLDGFHRGEVTRNLCINRRGLDAYPFGGYAIVMNNTNPDMHSEEIVIEQNEIEGTRFGGIFVIGEQHQVRRNRMRRLNLARCGDPSSAARCAYAPDQPLLLRSAIYLGSGAERPSRAQLNRIEDNQADGFGIASNCVVAAPGVSLTANRVSGNRCYSSD
ncbi:MAG: right-handed parallel beta-helix repeat-containing protein [Bryobacteraceae bacterium]